MAPARLDHPRLILFDVDGTIVDSLDHIMAAMERAFAAQGLPAPAREDVQGIIGLSLEEAMGRLAPRLAAEDHAALAGDYRKAFFDLHEEGGENAPLYAGMDRLISTLSSDPLTLLGVATGKSRRGLERLFRAHDLGRHFHTIQTADSHPSKPHPAMIEAALSETGVHPRRAFMVGDTTFDMEMARAAGVIPIGVAWGYHPPAALLDAGAEAIAGDVPSLLSLLAD